jgi:tricorn protease
VGYVHIPDMGNGGLVEYTKHYFPLVQQKDGMIYDVRYNGGGYISAMLLMQMASRPINYYKPRYGASWPREDWAFRGYSAAVCNDQNYSDAEYFVDGFKKLKIGPVFGAQTGGGEVGSGGGYPLIDGGKIWIPNYGGWSPDGNWIVEGVGANPDVLVQQDPAAVLAGRDPQLDAAIAYLKDKLAKAPIPKLVPPPFPVVRSGTRAAK